MGDFAYIEREMLHYKHSIIPTGCSLEGMVSWLVWAILCLQ